MLCTMRSMDDQLRKLKLAPSISLLRRKEEAMAKVRKGLTESNAEVDDSVLCAILLLAVLEGIFQATSVRDEHKNALSKPTSLKGGLQWVC
jgi:hypothetical protein